jgi:flagellar biosynthesis anti-sigma factor FlgM
MTMNINLSPSGSSASVSGAREIQVSKTARFNEQVRQLPQDTTTISPFSELVTAALNQPELRADKVSALRAAIAAGTYKVDPHAVAAAMVADQL